MSEDKNDDKTTVKADLLDAAFAFSNTGEFQHAQALAQIDIAMSLRELVELHERNNKRTENIMNGALSALMKLPPFAAGARMGFESVMSDLNKSVSDAVSKMEQVEAINFNQACECRHPRSDHTCEEAIGPCAMPNCPCVEFTGVAT